MSFVENLGKISKLDTYDVTTEVKYYKNRGYEEISRHYIVNLESSYDKDFLKTKHKLSNTYRPDCKQVILDERQTSASKLQNQYLYLH